MDRREGKKDAGRTVYYSDGLLLIRSMEKADAAAFCREEIAQGWVNASEEKYLGRLADAAAGKSAALAAEYRGEAAGYVNVYWETELSGGKGCAIVDLGVLEKYQNRGIGSRLMDAAEKIAAQYGDTVFLEVGLHSGYGSAQRMYIKRGYLPDGSGIRYNGQVCNPYERYCNDDELTLRFSKKLR
jgi:ribosomal protein S18 acetylase RimI-like enzyme